MGRPRKKKDYVIVATTKKDKKKRVMEVVFIQKAWEIDRAFLLAHKTLVRNNLWIQTITVLYPGRAPRKVQVELMRQNRQRKSKKTFVWW